jgi:hypothetical protein
MGAGLFDESQTLSRAANPELNRRSSRPRRESEQTLFRFVLGGYPAITKTEVEAAAPRLPHGEHTS